MRVTLAPNLEDGMAYVYGIRSCDMPCARRCMLRAELDKLAVSSEGTPAAVARPRPAPTALQELHTLQALDGTLAGASLREVAEGVFGTDAVVTGWYADGGLRSRVRRLVTWFDADAWRLSPPGPTQIAWGGSFCLPCKTTLNGTHRFLETVSIWPRSAAGLS